MLPEESILKLEITCAVKSWFSDGNFYTGLIRIEDVFRNYRD